MCVPVLSFPSSSFLSLSCRSLAGLACGSACRTRLWTRLQDAPVDAPVMCVPVLSCPSSSSAFLSLSFRSLPCGTRLWTRLQDAPGDAPSGRAWGRACGRAWGRTCNARSCPVLSFLVLSLSFRSLPCGPRLGTRLQDAPGDAPSETATNA